MIRKLITITFLALLMSCSGIKYKCKADSKFYDFNECFRSR